MNPYYRPEEMGLKIVASIEYDPDSYGFDTRVVWKDQSGHLYTARDSGCSCPTSFENYTSIDKLDRVFNLGGLRLEVHKFVLGNHFQNPGTAQEFLYRVRQALRSSAR
jgi:hypothetical protein